MPAIPAVSLPDTQPAAGAKKPASMQSLKMQGIQNSFSNYMQQNPSGTAQASKQQDTASQETVKTAGSDTDVKQQYEQYQNQPAADKVNSTPQDGSEETGALNETVEEAVEAVKDLIKENLGIDDEQLQAAMELLGLTQADLLNPQQLIALSVELTGSQDAGMMLFHENFQNLMQETTVVTQDLLKELGMTMEELMEQVQKLTDTAPKQEDYLMQAEAPAEEVPQQAAQETVQTPEVQKEVQESPQQALAAVPEKEVQPENQTQQAQAQPQETQETEKLQKPQEVQENSRQPQADVEQQAQEGTSDLFTNENDTNEQTRFDFHGNMHAQEPAVNVPQPQNMAAQTPLPQVNMQDVIEQIVEHTKIHLSEDVKSIEMQLNPENLGKVYLHVSEKQGAVTAQLVAQNENIKEALVQQAAILKENLNQQGIKVDAVEVSVGTHEFERNLERDAHQEEEQARQREEQNAGRRRRGINLNDLNGLDGLSGLMSEEEMLAARIMQDNGNNLDYKA